MWMLSWARGYIQGDNAFHTTAITDVLLTMGTPQEYRDY